MTDLHELSGDVADLLDYRLDEHGLHPALWFPPVGRSCTVITCEVAGLPAKFWPMPDATEEDPAAACPQCGSKDPGIAKGLSFCPNDFHYPHTESNWRRIVAYIAGIAIIGVWLLALFLYIAGVI